MKRFLAVSLILLFAAVAVTAYFFIEDNRESAAIEKYSQYVVQYSFKYEVDANLVYAVMKAESGFNEKALSEKGASGLMQIMPQTGEYIASMLGENYSAESLAETETNIRYGTYYLGYLLKKFENIGSAIAAYNAGEGNVSYWLTKYSFDGKTLTEIPFKETEVYQGRVLKYFSNFRKKYNY